MSASATGGGSSAGDAADRAKDAVDDAAARAEDTHDRVGQRVAPWADNAVFRGMARAGFVITGVLSALVGWTAIRMALGVSGGDAADQSGAARLVEAAPGGSVVLVGGAVACLILAVWLVVEGIGGSAGTDSRGDRLRYLGTHLGKAVVYAALAVAVVNVVVNTGADAEAAADDTSATLLQSWVGTALLALGALVAISVGAVVVWIGVTRRFERQLRLDRAGAARPVIIGVSVVGFVARGLAFVLIGTALMAAVITKRPEHAAGLSGALKSLTELPFGVPVLVAIGVGLVVGGMATALRAWVQDMDQAA